MSEPYDWWSALFGAARWASAHRRGARGRADDPEPLAAIDLAAGALADPQLADPLEAERIDLELLERALLAGVAVGQDLDALDRGSGAVAWRRGASDVSIEHVFAYLLSVPEVGAAAQTVGLEPGEDGPRVSGAITLGRSVGRALRSAWPIIGRFPAEQIVIDDHPTVTRQFVFDLLTERGGLTPVGALRAIRRIELRGRAPVFVGSPSAVAERFMRLRDGVIALGSPLVVRRAPRASPER